LILGAGESTVTFGEDAGVDVTEDGPGVLPESETNNWVVINQTQKCTNSYTWKSGDSLDTKEACDNLVI